MTKSIEVGQISMKFDEICAIDGKVKKGWNRPFWFRVSGNTNFVGDFSFYKCLDNVSLWTRERSSFSDHEVLT